MGLRMKIFNITGVHWKIRFLGDGGEWFTKKQYVGYGKLRKKGDKDSV